MCASSVAIRCAISRTTVRIVPSAGSRTDAYARVGGARHRRADQHRVDQLAGAARPAPRRRRGSAARGSRRCCRARRAARRARPTRRSRRGRSRRSCGPRRSARRSSSSSTARSVSAMLSPVSPSATGNTLRSLTSCAARFELRERALDDGAKARDEARTGADDRRHCGERRLTRRPSVTLPAFRQRVQTYTRRGAPSSMIRTFWRFGSKRRLVATIEWLRLWPNAGPLPQL